MIDFQVLKQYGTTNERLKEIFTAKNFDPQETPTEDEKAKRQKDIERREDWERRIMDRLHQGILFGLQNYKLWAAVDLATDSTPLNKDTYPLMLYAQGKVDFASCLSNYGCNALSTDSAIPSTIAPYVQRTGDKITGFELPKFVDTAFNLVRSVTSRRIATQCNKYNNLWPFYKYESRSTGLPGKVRADVLSQRVDIMVDDYDYRGGDTQAIRDMFYYAHAVSFVRSSWDVQKQIERVDLAPEATVSGGDFPVRTVIVKEGLDWITPHPSRVFWDSAYPLSSINSDTGCEYIGFWDVKRYRDVKYNSTYFNRENISYSGGLWDAYSTYQLYFTQNLSTIVAPPRQGVVPRDPAGENDRSSTIGMYAQNMDETSIFVAEEFEKIIPVARGVGTYPYPVWVRKVVASDRTVIYAEFLPSTPAAYLGFNESDKRLVNPSVAHELLSYQDMLTNLLTAARTMLEAECAKIICLNTDALIGAGEDDGKLAQARVQELRKKFGGKNWASNPIVVEFSAARCQELNLKPDDVVKLAETRMGQSIDTIFKAISQLIAIVDRLTGMSPAEQGQPAPREITATETAEISTTTKSIETFISDGVDAFRAAKKRIIYESLVACGCEEIKMPVQDRYSKKAIEAAGFKIDESEDEDYSDPNVKRRTVIGSTRKLIHNYTFTTRDGAERPVNTQAANTLVQSLATIITIPTVLNAIGKEQLYEMLNEIFRLSGAGYDLNLELKEGEDNSIGQDQMEQLQGIVQQIAQAVKQNAQDIAEQQHINQTQQQMLGGVNELAKVVNKSAKDIDRLFGRVDQLSEDMQTKQTKQAA